MRQSLPKATIQHNLVFDCALINMSLLTELARFGARRGYKHGGPTDLLDPAVSVRARPEPDRPFKPPRLLSDRPFKPQHLPFSNRIGLPSPSPSPLPSPSGAPCL